MLRAATDNSPWSVHRGGLGHGHPRTRCGDRALRCLRRPRPSWLVRGRSPLVGVALELAVTSRPRRLQTLVRVSWPRFCGRGSPMDGSWFKISTCPTEEVAPGPAPVRRAAAAARRRGRLVDCRRRLAVGAVITQLRRSAKLSPKLSGRESRRSSERRGGRDGQQSSACRPSLSRCLLVWPHADGRHGRTTSERQRASRTAQKL